MSIALHSLFSVRSPRQFRAFFLYRKEIRQTVSAELMRFFPLSWSHYVTLPENANIHASEYQLYLPSKEEFKAQIDRAVETVEDHGREAD